MFTNNAKIAGIAVILLLLAVIATLVLRADSRAPGGDSASLRGVRTIAEENELAGSTDWRITKPSLVGEIAGYAGQASVNRGDTLDLNVSTARQGAKHDADIYRMGWYGGAGARVVRSIRNIEGETQGRWDPLVGNEYDHMAVPDERPPGLTIVGSSPVNGFIGSDTAISAMYRVPSGARVFAAGTVAWSWGLDDFGHEDRGAFADDRLRRVTANILDRLSRPGQAPPLLP